MIYSQGNIPPIQHDPCDTVDLGVLDRTTLTSVVDFMHKFASDASFTPPTMDVMYDTDKFSLSVDDEIDSYFEDDVDVLSDMSDLRAREKFK